MDAAFEDCYVVFVRDKDEGEPVAEHPVVNCSTYEEAEGIRRMLARPSRQFLIRYVGPAGGGD